MTPDSGALKLEIPGAGGRTVELVLGDITLQDTDAIVNAANSGLLGGAGVDGAIHRAGGPEIMKECRELGGCPTGSACITTAGRLKARFVIHAVGPIWSGGGSGEAGLLASAYRASLDLADEHRLASVSFPSISTGAYRFPLEQAAPIALATVIEHLKGETGVRKVVFMLFNQVTFDAYAAAVAKTEYSRRSR
ncbi:MAG: O-acetyl-ADP-ribose deacetylase [Actinobacteria bacterium]|nr:O-acetyl-ADP-ribose deacetylase [Actinomycetota bacterium]